MSGIQFVNMSHNEIMRQFLCVSKSGGYAAYIRGQRCVTEEDFFWESSAALQFPWYFGENWGAFDECAGDLLDWLSFNKLLVIIDNYRSIFEGSDLLKRVLLRHLTYMVEDLMEQNIAVEILLNN